MRFLILAVLAACGTTTEDRLAFSSARTGAPGELGPHRVVATKWQAQARVTESILVNATYPIPIDTTPLPTVLFIHEGAAAPSRYQWLYDHLASRGYTVIVPGFFGEVPLIELDNATIALDAAIKRGLTDPNQKIAILGHGYGGTVAAKLFGDDERYAALGLLAAIAGPEDPKQRGRSILAITGSTDTKWAEGQVRYGLLRYEPPRFFGVVTGMNHYAWTDEPTQRETDTDGVLIGTTASVRTAATRILDTWLDAVLRDDPNAAAALIPLVEEETSVP